MRILLVYPETPGTFWSFKKAVRFVSKRASGTPLGLLTVAAMLPEAWERKLVDMNVARLRDRDIEWADYVFLGGMSIHAEQIKNVIARANALGTPVVGGGPAFTMTPEEYPGTAHMVLNEAEITFPRFLQDLLNGTAEPVYTTDDFPDITTTPAPEWDLLDLKRYSSVDVQYSRGCPFNCEFCSITWLNGHRPRTKDTDQFLSELQSLYDVGWRGGVFVVDDNFIGNRKKLKEDMLPALIEWSKQHSYPFNFVTEVSINLAEDEELVRLMVQAGFHVTFVGIESPNTDSLNECRKTQNLRGDLIESVRTLHRHGLMVYGGFIVGFDNDPPTIFDTQISFIQESGIVAAMVGLLNAPVGTRLYSRMKKEKRLLNDMSGDNTDGSINFVPKMDIDTLKGGYRRLVNTIYAPKVYFERVRKFLSEYNMPATAVRRFTMTDIRAFLKSIFVLGIAGRGRSYYWKLLFATLRDYPEKFGLAVRLAIYGYHFRTVAAGV